MFTPNPLTLLADLLQAAKDRLLALNDQLHLAHVRREAQHQADLAACECEANGRAYQRLKAAMPWARNHVQVARWAVDRVCADLLATSSPDDIAYDLDKARRNLRAADARLRLFSEDHAEAIADTWSSDDQTAWFARLNRVDVTLAAVYGDSDDPFAGYAIETCDRCKGPLNKGGRVTYNPAGVTSTYCSHACWEAAQGIDPNEQPSWADYAPDRYAQPDYGRVHPDTGEIDERHEVDAGELRAMQEAEDAPHGRCRYCSAPRSAPGDAPHPKWAALGYCNQVCFDDHREEHHLERTDAPRTDQAPF